MKHLPYVCVYCCLVFGGVIFVQNVFSATTQTITLGNIPLAIDQLQEFEINVQFSCTSCSSDSYLRGVFYPSGTSYFGYTQDNSGNWSNAPGANCTSYYKIAQSDLKEGSWSGVLKFKPDVASSYYAGPGEYLFKVGRYTPSCNSASIWSTEMTVAIIGPTPTLIPVPTSTPTSNPTPTVTSTPTKTPTPTRLPTVTSIQPSRMEEATEGGTLAVLGEESIARGISATSSGSLMKPVIISMAFVSLGMAILSGVFVWQKRKAIKPPEAP